MGTIFKSIFHTGKSAVLNPPPDASADLSLAPQKSADGTAAAPAAESAAPVVTKAAVLQDLLIKNFLLDEPSAQTAAPYAPPAPPAYAHIPDPLPDLSSHAEGSPQVNPDVSPGTSRDAPAEAATPASTDSRPHSIAPT